MRTSHAALHTEGRKACASRVLRTTSVLLVAGIAALAGTLVAAARGGNEQILAQLGPLAEETGWTLLTGVTAQITAAGALLAFGVALSWTFGREFTDGTITGLFALPVTRPAIALAKLGIHLVWTVGVAGALTLLVLVGGLLLELGPVDGETLGRLGRQGLLTVMTGLLATPVAWVATLGRGQLPGIAATLVIIIAGQVTAIAAPEAAAWFPFASPAAWALRPDAVHAGQLGVVAVVPIASAALTAIAWQRLQLDR